YVAILFTFILGLPTLLQAQEDKVELIDGITKVPIIKRMDFLLDTAAIFSIQEIASEDLQSRFRKVTDNHVVYGYLDSPLWLRLQVSNQMTQEDISWYFESWGFDIKDITFYFPNSDGTFSALQAGFGIPFPERRIKHKNFNYYLDLRPGEEKTYYLRITRHYNHEFTFFLRTNEAFLNHSFNEYFLLGIYYGVLILIVISNMYLFFKMRDTLYIYFICLILACIWFCLGRDGLGFQYLWPNYPWLNRLNNEYFIELIIILTTLLFSNRFIQKYTKSSRTHKLTSLAVLLKLGFFINQVYFVELYYVTYIVITIIILLIPFSHGLYILAKSGIYSWPYIFAYLCLFLVIIYSYGKSIELFNNPVINWYLVYPVIFLETVFFSFSIFNQIKFLQQESIQANKEKTLALEKNNQLTLELNSQLKEKVRERTEEIEKMAESLAQKNVELQTTNLKLQELNTKVTQLNSILQINNEELKTSVEEITKNLALMKGLDFEGFKQVFPDKESCLKFLSELKWKNRYSCKKCQYNKYNEDANYGRRCKNCNYYESPTVDTLFHKIKFPIEKAFYILYLSNRKDVDMTLNELSDILELRRETCWAFKNKIALAMEKVQHNKELSGWETLALVHLE
ncbi:MAG: 7TM-DISM domain-containing protein, partial [Cyclobacteriaceae bacterium]